MRTIIIGEIGICHLGDVEIAKQMMDVIKDAGGDYAKFQKRTLSEVYTDEELDKDRAGPWGNSNRDLKEKLEISQEDYDEIDRHSKEIGLPWFGSAWDRNSVDFLDKYNPKYHKIASAMLTDHAFLRHVARKKRDVILSTGMSTMEQIGQAIDVISVAFGDNIPNLYLMHTTSTYPTAIKELNLRCIQTLQEEYRLPTGYSGHEVGIVTTVAAVAMGAEMVERHLTMDRSFAQQGWSDHSAALEPDAFKRMVKYIRTIEAALGTGVKRVYESELPIIEKLRKVDDTAT